MGFEGRFFCWGEMEIVWWMGAAGWGDGRDGSLAPDVSPMLEFKLRKREKKDRRTEE